MTCIIGNGIVLCGNFHRITRYKPKNWIDEGYTMYVPYEFKWREKIGDTECDCKEILESFQPYHGVEWYHTQDCKLIRKITENPRLINLYCFSHLPKIPTDE